MRSVSTCCASSECIRALRPLSSNPRQTARIRCAFSGCPGRSCSTYRRWVAQIVGAMSVSLKSGGAAYRSCHTLTMVVAIARPKLEGNVAVGETRQIGFAGSSAPQGRAVFWLHGTPGARRQIPTEGRVFAEEADIRLIGIDRPGIGASTPYQYPNVLAFAEDIRTVADTLGIDKMAVVGLSGGGPYTLACAAAMPERVVAAGVLRGRATAAGPDAIGGGA